MTDLIKNEDLELNDIGSILQIKEQMMGDYSVQAVDARSLHKALGVGKFFANWIKDVIKHLNLVENTNYEVFAKNGKNPNQGGRPTKEYNIALQVAKSIAMVSNTEAGERVREYFLTCERATQQVTQGVATNLITNEDKAYGEFNNIINNISPVIEKFWGKGYAQKQIVNAATTVDGKYNTNISKEFPLPIALPGQKEEIDPTKGEHLLRQAVGSKELSTTKFAEAVGTTTTKSLNAALIALNFQVALRDPNKRNNSGYQLVPGKDAYANQKPISTKNSPFLDELKIVSWVFNSFSTTEIEKIKEYIKKHFTADLI